MSLFQKSLIFSLLLITAWIGSMDASLAQDPTLPTAEETGKMAQEADKTRRENVMMATEALQGAQVYLQAKDWPKSIERFNYVIKMTDPNNDGKKLHAEALVGLAKADVGLANDEIGQNDFDGAQKLLDAAQGLDSQNKDIAPTLRLLKTQKIAVEAQRRDPQSIENNPTVTPEFIQRVASVQKLLFEGDRFFETGQYDKADGRFRQALVVDPYNKAARQRLEKLDRVRLKAAAIAHDTARDQAMYDVERRWHEVEKADDSKTVDTNEKNSQESNLAKIVNKLTTIKITEISFNQTPVEEAISQLQAKSRELDPDKEGVNFVIKTKISQPPLDTTKKVAPGTAITAKTVAGTSAAAPAPTAAPGPPPITLHLTNVTLDEALRLVTSLANLKYKIEEYAVFVLPVTDSTSALITHTFSVPPGFFNGGLTAPSATGIGGPTIRPTNEATAGPSVDSVKIDVKQQLVDQGVEFPNGSTAAFLAGSSKLVVKNTAEQIEFIDSLIQARQIEEPQIEIETKYVEFSDTSLKELSFNWGMSALGSVDTIPLIENSRGVLQTPVNAYPGLNNIFMPNLGQNLSASGAQFAGGTANRTQADIPQNGLDQILASPSVDNTGTLNTSSNQLFLGAVLGTNAFGLLANLIDQLKGVDLLSAPKLTVKNRNAGKVEIAREMRYPTNFTQPKFNNEPIEFDGLVRILLLPPTPSDFAVEPVGVVLDVTPTAYPDRRIDLELKQK